ncbi:MAG TPA: hypothetical protein DEF42_08100 [Desulfosporosinus sp.]|nr:hypothetical protein [Desulfosporosinus sp.]
MYSLPITTYSDYWRRTKLWSAYFGSLAVLVAGTRYAALEEPGIRKAMPQSLQAMNALSLERMRTDIQFDGLLGSELNQGLGVHSFSKQGEISRGVDSQKDLVDKLEARATSKVEIKDEELPFDTQYIESDKLPPGTSKLQVKGENGTRREVVKTFEVGGQPIDQQVQAVFELEAPKKEIILRNTKPIPKKKVTIENSTPKAANLDVDLTKLNISKTLTVEATAYTYTGNNTATGVKPREGLIAVDPRVIPMGSKVYVEGYGYAIAADTGGSIRGNRIDVFYSTLRKCIDWGRRSVQIHVLNPT